MRQVINAVSQGTRYQLGPIKTEFSHHLAAVDNGTPVSHETVRVSQEFIICLGNELHRKIPVLVTPEVEEGRRRGGEEGGEEEEEEGRKRRKRKRRK